MAYYVDFSQVSLDQFKKYLKADELVPSRQLLLNDLPSNFNKLKAQGFDNIASILLTLKNKNKFKALAKTSEIEENYLLILSREIRSWLPKSEKISDFTAFDENTIHSLFEAGYKNTKLLWEAGLTPQMRKIIATNTKTKLEDIDKLVCLSDLCRVRWVNSTFSQMLWMANVRSAKELALTEYPELHTYMVALNKKHQWYKGNIGLNDFRLVKQAAKRLSFDLKI